MHALSTAARFILDRMEPDRRYAMVDLRAFVPDASAEQLREVMHELWLNRQVERVGHAGWQRHRSAAPHGASVGARRGALDAAPAAAFRQKEGVKPEDLFDHDAFTDFFR
jgi:hypothetical protein